MKRIISILAAVVVLSVAGEVFASCSVPNCREQGGARWTIGSGGSLDILSGGELDVESGGAFKLDGTAVTATADELNSVDVGTPGTVEASKAVVVDANLDASVIRNLGVTNLDAGLSGAAGTVDVFPVTPTRGKLAITAANSAGDTTTTIVNASQAGARTYTIPDAGASADFMMTQGAQTVVGAQTYSAAATFNNTATHADDITVSTNTGGGNAGARWEFIGVPKLRMVSFGTGTNGTTETKPLFSDTPASECAGVTATAANDNAIVRAGTNSLKVTFGSTPGADEGADCTFAGGADDFGSNESIGFWFRTDTALQSGDVYVELDDDGGTDVQFNLPAVATVDQWTWIELDISTCATCDVVDAAKLLISAGGATRLAAGGNIWFDLMYKWDADDEDAIAQAILQDGVIGVLSVVTSTGGNRTPVLEVENTDYLIHYESASNDFLVWVTDMSGNSLWATVAIE